MLADISKEALVKVQCRSSFLSLSLFNSSELVSGMFSHPHPLLHLHQRINSSESLPVFYLHLGVRLKKMLHIDGVKLPKFCLPWLHTSILHIHSWIKREESGVKWCFTSSEESSQTLHYINSYGSAMFSFGSNIHLLLSRCDWTAFVPR